MVSSVSATQPDQAPVPVKIVIAGGFGAGKTTLVGSVSDIEPLSTEALMTEASRPVDNLEGLPQKATTTVAMDFGRLALTHPASLELHLFGLPGQERFWFTWPDLARGAIGVVVLADTRRLQHSFGPLTFFEERRVPFIVAVNQFEDTQRFDLETVRDALELSPAVPVLRCDARDRRSSADVLIELVRHALTHHPTHGTHGAAL